MNARPARRLALAVLCAVASFASIATSTGCVLPLEEAHDQWKKSYPIAAGGAVEVRNTNGQIRVEASEGATVEVVAERSARAGSQEDAKNALARMEIRETVSASRIEIDSTKGGAGFEINVSRRVDYVVKVPKGLSVTLVTTNGEIIVGATGGAVHMRTTNGPIKASAVDGAIEAETTNGDVEIEIAKLATDGVRCETTNGSVEITLPAGTKADFDVRTNNGRIDTSGFDVATTEKTRRQLRGSAGGGGPLVRLETTNGGIRIRGR